ncbi:hypothetical protein D3C73_1620730 [compost metagenome]
MVECFHVLQGRTPQQPADDRGDGFDDAEDEAGAQGIGEAGLAHGSAFADRRGERIGGHGKADQ